MISSKNTVFCKEVLIVTIKNFATFKSQFFFFETHKIPTWWTEPVLGKKPASYVLHWHLGLHFFFFLLKVSTSYLGSWQKESYLSWFHSYLNMSILNDVSSHLIFDVAIFLSFVHFPFEFNCCFGGIL